MKPSHARIWRVTTLVLATVSALGQVATNDAFASRLRVEGSSVHLVTSNSKASKEPGEPNHAGNKGGASLWWLWHPSQSGYLVLDTGGSGFDTLLAVYFGKALNSLSPIATNRVGAVGVTNRVEFDADPQRDYCIAVDGANGSTGEVHLNLELYTFPVLINQPQSLEVTDGDNATFTVNALGNRPLIYQWQFKGTNLLGQTGPTLTLRAVAKDQAGPYRVVVSNNYGSTNSAVATLSVLGCPKTIRDPVGATRDSGDSVTFSVLAIGEAPLNYQWFHYDIAMPGARDWDLTLTNLSTDDAGFYRVEVTNAVCKANSAAAELVVVRKPPRIITHPQDQTVVEGTNVTMPVAVAGYRPMSFQWQRSGAPLEGMTNQVLTLKSVTPNDSGLYLVVITNRYGRTNSLEARLIVEPIPPNDKFERRIDVGSTPAMTTGFNKHGTAEPGEPRHDGQPAIHSVWWSYTTPNLGVATVDLKGSSFDTRLAVYQGKSVDRLTPVTSNNNADGLTKVVFLTQPGEEYEIAVDGAGGQEGNIQLAVTFDPSIKAPIFSLEPLGGLALSGGTGGAGGGGCRDYQFTVSTVSIAPVSYQWQFNGTDLIGETNSALSLKNVVAEQAGAYRVIACNLGGCITSQVAQLNVSLQPDIRKEPQDKVVRDCGNTRLEIEGDGGCKPLTYQWFNSNGPMPGATSPILSFQNAQPTQSGPYFVVLDNGNGARTSRVANLFVDATPIITQQPNSYLLPVNDCDDVRFSVGVAPGCRPNSFQWYRNNEMVSNATSSVLQFNATADAAGDYTVRVYNEYASTNSQPAKLRVKAEPAILGHPDSQRVRIGAVFTNRVQAQTNCSKLTFLWRKDGKPATLDGLHLLSPEGFLIVSNAAPADSGRYDVVVSSLTGASTSRVANVQVLVPPPNDDFKFGLRLAGTNLAVLGTNIVASAEAGEPAHAKQPARKSVWYEWTAPTPCLATVGLSANTLYDLSGPLDTLLGVYLGAAVNQLTLVTNDDQGGGNGASKVSFLAARGKTFHLAVDGSAGAEGTFQLNLQAQEILSPPLIRTEPSSAAATNGNTVQFAVVAEGSPDILYQWSFNAVPISGATNSVLVLTNVQPANEGNYTVFLSNEFGATNSAIARLTFGAIITGQVTDATNGRGIPGATVYVGAVSTNTDEGGNYTLVGVRPGEANADFDAKKRVVGLNEKVIFNNRSTLSAVTLRCEKRPEYIDYEDNQFVVGLGQAVTNKFSLSPMLDGMRFVVNWGLQPADLDAHLLTPEIGGVSYHLQYSERGGADVPPWALLDHDVTNSFGPETVTIYKIQSGIYRFYVKKFDPNEVGPLTASKAIVKVYTSAGPYGTREVPTTGTGSVWHVCDIDGDRMSITWMDQILTADPPAPVLGKSNSLSLAQPLILGGPRGVELQSNRPQNARFEWDLGDGWKTNGLAPEHAYGRPGQYTVTLTMFSVLDTNKVVDVESKTNFITVFNVPPAVSFTNPPTGKLFRAGPPVVLEAEASDTDGFVAKVEFLQVLGQRTNILGRVDKPPYRLEATNLAPGSYTFQVRAIDNFDAATLSALVSIRVLDLSGDVLIVQNHDDPEIARLVDYLDDITVPVEGGDPRHLVVRVIDPEGLYLDLISTFKLIIWNDLGRIGYGLTDNLVEVLSAAKRSGIPLYLIGERLGGSAYPLDGDSAVAWQALTHLAPPIDSLALGEVQVLNTRPQHEFFSQIYGRVQDFKYESELELCELADDQGEVVATVNGHPVMLRDPAYETPDFGQPRLVSQDFRVGNGKDAPSLEERRKLFLNVVSWLLRLTDCSSFGGYPSCEDTMLIGRVGEPITLSALVTQNGECQVGGIILTNLLTPSAEVRSFEALAASGAADTNAITWTISSNQVVCRFSKLPSGTAFRLLVTAVPKRAGYLTNLATLRLGLLSPRACQQVALIQAPACDGRVTLAARVASSGQVVLTALGATLGCSVQVQSSTNLLNWTEMTNSIPDDEPFEIKLGPAQQKAVFYRVVLKP